MINKILLLLLLLSTNVFAIEPTDNYFGTELKTYAELNDLFISLNKRTKRKSQCYERAHVWSYEMFESNNIHSYKAFIFFTNKYRALFDNKWWFHVAPSVKLNSDHYVFDPEFLKKPVTLEAWKNGAIDIGVKYLSTLKRNFTREIIGLNKELERLNDNYRRDRKRIRYIKKRLSWIDSEERRLLIKDSKLIKATELNWPYNDSHKEIVDLDCPIIKKYSHDITAKESNYCYILISNMYVWEPNELADLENQDHNKDDFVMGEIFTSFKRAFKGHYPF